MPPIVKNTISTEVTGTLLITGASCEMGSSLIRKLLRPSLKIRAMVNQSLVNIPGCETRPGNLKNPELLARAVSGAEIVVHVAALTKSASESDYFETNVNGTKNLIDTCLEQGVQKIIYVSSLSASLDGGGYASSKLEAEECIKKSGLKWVIVRPSEVYGQRAGDSINQLIQFVKKYYWVPVIGSGQSKLSPVFIDDVVSAMVLSIFNVELENRIVTLAGPETLTYNALVDRIAVHFGVKRFKLHLPASLVKFTAMILSKLGINILVPDQIPRLLCKKSYEIDLAKEKLNYSPRCIEEGIKKNGY
jgi:nucleoside-diphosphate-sugar epimerase